MVNAFNSFVFSLNQQPADCRILIDKLKACSDEQLLVELQHIKTWNIGKVCTIHVGLLDFLEYSGHQSCTFLPRFCSRTQMHLVNVLVSIAMFSK